MTIFRIAFPALALLSLALSSCVTDPRSSYGPAELNGFPGWVMDGAQLEDPPPPRRPDLMNEHTMPKQGAVGFGFKERVETPEQAKARKKAVDDLFGR